MGRYCPFGFCQTFTSLVRAFSTSLGALLQKCQFEPQNLVGSGLNGIERTPIEAIAILRFMLFLKRVWWCRLNGRDFKVEPRKQPQIFPETAASPCFLHHRQCTKPPFKTLSAFDFGVVLRLRDRNVFVFNFLQWDVEISGCKERYVVRQWEFFAFKQLLQVQLAWWAMAKSGKACVCLLQTTTMPIIAFNVSSGIPHKSGI